MFFCQTPRISWTATLIFHIFPTFSDLGSHHHPFCACLQVKVEVFFAKYCKMKGIAGLLNPDCNPIWWIGLWLKIQSQNLIWTVNPVFSVKVKIVYYLQTKNCRQSISDRVGKIIGDPTIPKKSSTFAPPHAQWVIRWENMQYESISSCNKYVYSSII